jgi:hypothetical protein
MGHPSFSILYVFEKFEEYEPSLATRDGIHAMLDECLATNPEKNQLIKDAIERYASQNFYQNSTDTREAPRATSSGSTPSRIPPPATAPTAATTSAPTALVLPIRSPLVDAVGQKAIKKRKTGNVDLEERHGLKDMNSGKEKLMCINRLGLVDDATARNALTGGALTFSKLTIKSVRGCFKHHCKESVDCFVTKWGNFGNSTFNKSL